MIDKPIGRRTSSFTGFIALRFLLFLFFFVSVSNSFAIVRFDCFIHRCNLAQYYEVSTQNFWLFRCRTEFYLLVSVSYISCIYYIYICICVYVLLQFLGFQSIQTVLNYKYMYVSLEHPTHITRTRTHDYCLSVFFQLPIKSFFAFNRFRELIFKHCKQRIVTIPFDFNPFALFLCLVRLAIASITRSGQFESLFCMLMKNRKKIR